MAAFFHTVDQSILLWLQDAIRCPALSALLVPLTIVGEGGIIWILISAVMLFFPRTRKIGWMALVAMLLCYLLNDKLFKVLVERPRPLFAMANLQTLIPIPLSWSFPSGHACSSFAAATIYSHGGEKRWLKAVFWALAVTMAFSRMYVGVHYPTDVLAGALVGVVGSSLIWRMLQRRYDLIEAHITEHRRTA